METFAADLHNLDLEHFEDRKILEGRGKWMIIRRTSGQVVEESKVFVAPNTKLRRNKRKGTTTAEKQEENDRSGARRLARVFNCNFTYGDVLLTLKYSPEGLAQLEAWAKDCQAEGESWEDALVRAAEHEAEKYLGRIRRLFKKMEIPLKYVLFTSDMNGETGEAVRIHHHMVLPQVSWEQAKDLWTMGWVDYQYLKKQDDYTPLAVYLCRQVRRRPDAKKYKASRNLKRPVVNERWDTSGEELKPDRGGKLMERGPYEPGKPQYIRFVKKAKPEQVKPRPGAKGGTGGRGGAPGKTPAKGGKPARGVPGGRG